VYSDTNPCRNRHNANIFLETCLYHLNTSYNLNLLTRMLADITRITGIDKSLLPARVKTELMPIRSYSVALVTGEYI
jgi:hypothetical protein